MKLEDTVITATFVTCCADGLPLMHRPRDRGKHCNDMLDSVLCFLHLCPELSLSSTGHHTTQTEEC